MSKRLPILLVTIAALGVGVFVGLRLPRSSDGSDNSSTPAKLGATKATKFSMNVVVSGVPFWTEARATWAKMPDVYVNTTATYGGPTNTDAQRQAEEIDALVAAGGIDGLFIYPGDSKTLTRSINGAADRGIPVVTFLTDCPESKRLTYITSDLEAAGERVATRATANKPQQGRAVVSYGQAGNDEQEARARGIRNVLSRTPEFRQVVTIEDKFDDAVGAEALRVILAQSKDITGIFGCDSRSAVGAVQALKESGYKPGEVIVSAWDFDNQVIDMINDGWIQASVAQNSEFMTYLGYTILLSQKEKSFGKFGKGDTRTLPRQIIVPVELITKENCEQYRRR